MSPTVARLERAHLSFHLLPLPKGVERTRSAGFIGDQPAAPYSKSTNKSFLCVGDRIIPLVPAKPVEETPRAQRLRAWLWAGSAADSLDLHSVVGGDWDSSIVYRAQVHDGRLLLAGTVERHQQVSGYNNTLMAEQACWWEYPLNR